MYQRIKLWVFFFSSFLLSSKMSPQACTGFGNTKQVNFKRWRGWGRERSWSTASDAEEEAGGPGRGPQQDGGWGGETTLSRKIQPLEGQAGLWGRRGCTGWGRDGQPSGWREAEKNTQRRVQGHIPQFTLKRETQTSHLKQKEVWDGNKMTMKHNEDSSSQYFYRMTSDLSKVNSEFMVELGLEPTAHLSRGFLHWGR